MTDMHREAFERWIQTTRGWAACKQRGKPFSLRQTVKGDYCDYRVNDRWYAYQAAIRHMTDQNEQRDSHE